jgi:hypothetical protein
MRLRKEVKREQLGHGITAGTEGIEVVTKAARVGGKTSEALHGLFLSQPRCNLGIKTGLRGGDVGQQSGLRILG